MKPLRLANSREFALETESHAFPLPPRTAEDCRSCLRATAQMRENRRIDHPHKRSGKSYGFPRFGDGPTRERTPSLSPHFPVGQANPPQDTSPREPPRSGGPNLGAEPDYLHPTLPGQERGKKSRRNKAPLNTKNNRAQLTQRVNSQIDTGPGETNARIRITR